MANTGIRATQLADLIRDILAPALQRDHAGIFVSINQVTLSTDLKQATVWVSIFPKEKQGSTMKELRRKSRAYYGVVRTKLNRHTIPTLNFEVDTSEEDQAHIDALLN